MAKKTESTPELNKVNEIVDTTLSNDSTGNTLDKVNHDDNKEKVSDVEIFGDDIWHLLYKASSESKNWMKSTKVMNVSGGCIVQVTTQNKDNVSESITFVPHNKFAGGKIVSL